MNDESGYNGWKNYPTWAVNQVDWHEIADSWLETAREAREYA